MNLIKPKKLEKGDTIAFIAPSGCIEKDKVLNAKKYFENKGYGVKLGKNVFEKDRYMAGSDKERVGDVENAFADQNIKAVMCVRGGYGVLRIINKINYDIIAQNPKIFCGYSDITALSAMIYKKTGLVTYSSPMPKGDFQPESINEYTEKHFFNAVCGKLTKIETKDLKTYRAGDAQGILWGGNLSTIASLCGTDFIPNEKLIFFAEDLNEPVYKIDRCFRQLLNTKRFRENLAAIILGDFLDIEYPQQLEELFFEISDELQIPVYGGYKISHSDRKITVPFGAPAVLNDGIIELL